MKPDELFEMLTDIDDKFIDDAMPESKNSDVVQPQKIQMTKRRFPWGIATAACLAVCVAVGAVIAVNVGKGKIPVEPNSGITGTEPSYAPECVFDYSGLEESELPPVEERHYDFTMREYPEQRFYTEITALGVELYAIDDGITHLTHYGLNNLYLYDFDNDGKREICMTYYDDQVPWRVDISVYDPEDRSFYCTDPGYIEYNYRLVVSGEKLMMEVSPSSVMDTVVHPAPSIEPLSLKRVAKDAEEIYTEDNSKELPVSFSIEELDVLPHFQIRDDKTIIRLSKPEMNIDGWEVFSDKVYVRSVYLCDLNGDGYREIAAAVTAENGDTFVKAYDAKAQKEYEYKPGNYESRWHYDNLTLKDGSLYLCMEDGSSESAEPLTLSDMKAVTQVDTVYTGSEQLPLDFIVAEVNLKFEISENKYLSLINWGAAASMDDWYSSRLMRDGTSVRRVFLCDLNADNVREIVAEVTGEDGENFIWAYNIPTKTEYVNTKFDALKVDGGALYLTYILAEAQNAEPLTLSQLTAVSHVDTIYTGSEQLPLEFGVDEAARSFRIDEYGLSVLNWGEMDAWDSSMILPGKVHYVYLCDLNGDERREIIAEVTGEDGEKLIWAFDILAETEYKTADYDSLVVGYGNLLYLVDVESESQLSLDDFTEVRCKIDFDETEMVGIYSPDNLNLKLPRYFKVNQWGGEFVLNEDGELWHNGNVSTRIFADKTVRSVWAADLNADGICEIVAAVSEGDSKSIVAYDHKTGTEYVYNGDYYELALDRDGLHAWRVEADETHNGDPNPLTIDQFT